MKASDFLRHIGKPIAYHPRLAKPLGGVNAAVLFGQLVYWSDKTDHELGVYKTAAEIEQETGLTTKEQETARKKLRELGVLHETHKRLEHRLYFKIDFDAYDIVMVDFMEKSAKRNSDIPDSQKGDSGNYKSVIRETTNQQSDESQKGDSYIGALDYQEITTEDYKHNTFADTSADDVCAENLPAVLDAEQTQPAVKKPAKPVDKEKRAANVACWDAYSIAYANRYGVDPIRNAKTNAMIAKFVEYVGRDDAPLIAAHYLTDNHFFYTNSGHDLSLLLRDFQKLRQQWMTGRKSTTTQARQADETQSRLSAFDSLAAKYAAEQE